MEEEAAKGGTLLSKFAVGKSHLVDVDEGFGIVGIGLTGCCRENRIHEGS